MLLHKRPLLKKYQNANVILAYYNAQCFIIELWKDAKDKKKPSENDQFAQSFRLSLP